MNEYNGTFSWLTTNKPRAIYYLPSSHNFSAKLTTTTNTPPNYDNESESNLDNELDDFHLNNNNGSTYDNETLSYHFGNQTYSRMASTTTLNPKIHDNNFKRYDFLLQIIGVYTCIGFILLIFFFCYARCLLLNNRKNRLFNNPELQNGKYKAIQVEQGSNSADEKNGKEGSTSQELSVITLIEETSVSTKKEIPDEGSVTDTGSTSIVQTAPNMGHVSRLSFGRSRSGSCCESESVTDESPLPGPSNSNSNSNNGNKDNNQVIKLYTLDWNTETCDLKTPPTNNSPSLTTTRMGHYNKHKARVLKTYEKY